MLSNGRGAWCWRGRRNALLHTAAAVAHGGAANQPPHPPGSTICRRHSSSNSAAADTVAIVDMTPLAYRAHYGYRNQNTPLSIDPATGTDTSAISGALRLLGSYLAELGQPKHVVLVFDGAHSWRSRRRRIDAATALGRELSEAAARAREPLRRRRASLERWRALLRTPPTPRPGLLDDGDDGDELGRLRAVQQAAEEEAAQMAGGLEAAEEESLHDGLEQALRIIERTATSSSEAGAGAGAQEEQEEEEDDALEFLRSADTRSSGLGALITATTEAAAEAAAAAAHSSSLRPSELAARLSGGMGTSRQPPRVGELERWLGEGIGRLERAEGAVCSASSWAEPLARYPAYKMQRAAVETPPEVQ
jgi:hypothetical protein